MIDEEIFLQDLSDNSEAFASELLDNYWTNVSSLSQDNADLFVFANTFVWTSVFLCVYRFAWIQ